MVFRLKIKLAWVAPTSDLFICGLIRPDRYILGRQVRMTTDASQIISMEHRAEDRRGVSAR